METAFIELNWMALIMCGHEIKYLGEDEVVIENCDVKQLVNDVFVLSRIIKVELGVTN